MKSLSLRNKKIYVTIQIRKQHEKIIVFLVNTRDEGELNMFQAGDYIVYKRSVCKIKEIKKSYMNGLDYYCLIPNKDESLKIEIPVSAPGIRELISAEEIEKIINEIPSISLIETDEKNLEQEYKKLLNSGSQRDLVKIIKTTYLRNKERIEKNKKIGDKDNRYFEEAERDLYDEFGIVLGLSLDETKDYVLNRVENLI